jgi:hypothetical protein
MHARRLVPYCAILLLSAVVARSKELQGYRCSADADCQFSGCHDQPCAGHEDDELCQNGVWAVQCVSICGCCMQEEELKHVAGRNGAAVEGLGYCKR